MTNINGGGFLVFDSTYKNLPDDFAIEASDSLLMRFDEDGNKLWEKTFASPRDNNFAGGTHDSFLDAIQTDSSHFVLSGTEREGTRVIKISQDGETIWDKAYEPLRGSQFIHELDQGGFLIVGDDFLVMKINSDGDLIWSKVLISEMNPNLNAKGVFTIDNENLIIAYAEMFREGSESYERLRLIVINEDGLVTEEFTLVDQKWHAINQVLKKGEDRLLVAGEKRVSWNLNSAAVVSVKINTDSFKRILPSEKTKASGDNSGTSQQNSSGGSTVNAVKVELKASYGVDDIEVISNSSSFSEPEKQRIISEILLYGNSSILKKILTED